jgi:hypothetical protein
MTLPLLLLQCSVKKYLVGLKYPQVHRTRWIVHLFQFISVLLTLTLASRRRLLGSAALAWAVGHGRRPRRGGGSGPRHAATDGAPGHMATDGAPGHTATDGRPRTRGGERLPQDTRRRTATGSRVMHVDRRQTSLAAQTDGKRASQQYSESPSVPHSQS